MIDVILFFQRIWEIVIYVLIWLAVQLAIGLWKIHGENRDSNDGKPYNPSFRPLRRTTTRVLPSP
jgi:hypothetical protein